MHSKRLIVAIIAVPLLFFYVTKLPPVFYLALLVLLSAIAQMEFNNMYRLNPLLSIISIVGGIFLLTTQYFLNDVSFNHQHEVVPTILIFFVMLITTVRLFQVRNPMDSLKDISPAVVGIVYIPLLLLPQWYIRLAGSEWIVILYGSVWASDSLAYYVGKGIGKKRLYYEVSPNKTIAGGVGSIIGGTVFVPLAAWGLGLFDSPKGFQLGVIGLGLIGFCIGFVTIIGDLVESMFKRDANIKDSGSILPGHGGILDKLDGVLFAGPVLYFIHLFLR
ncbi:MAG: phosphatidate cytidylyltransferase [Thermodesulfovibrionales bacterium]|nr:phosphatidate cytidylyltransferase [Thermodesulfovibrionales bacterium]